MFGAPSAPIAAAAQAVLVAGALLLFGYLLADRATPGSSLDVLVHWGLAFPALAAFTLLLKVAHMATGGWVFSHPGPTRAATGAVAVMLVSGKLIRRRRAPGVGRAEAAAVAALVGFGLVAWGWPVAQALPLPHNADISLWMGGASQLLNGEPTMTAPVTGRIPNAYPWLYHAFVAVLAGLTPGGRAFHALGPLQLVQVAGAVLTLFALGRELAKSWIGGAFAATFGALMGGFGYLLASGPDVVVDPRAPGAEGVLAYMGDLLFKRSYSFSFQNLAPPFPRDMSFNLLIGLLLLLALGLRRQNTYALVCAGIVLGLTGLTGAEAFFVGSATAVVLVLMPGPLSRLRVGLAVLLPALAVYAIWAAPIAYNYVRLGGFVNITTQGPVTLPAAAILVSWGVVTPFAAYGAFRCVADRAYGEYRVVVAFVTAATLLLVTASFWPAVMGEAFAVLGRHHRYWPLLNLGVALLGALGLTRLLRGLRRRPALMAGMAVVAAALPSPLLASMAVDDKVPSPPVLEASLRGDEDTFLNLMSPQPFGARCHSAVQARHGLLVFSYTGHRLVFFVWQTRKQLPNKARLRWADIYDYVPGDAQRAAANRILVSGQGSAGRWRQAARSYGVEIVVAPARRTDAPGFPSGRLQPLLDETKRFAIFRLGRCP